MTALFSQIFAVSLRAAWLVPAVLLVRLLLKKAPRWTHCLLWALVALRLLVPFTLESRLSVLPRQTITTPVSASVAAVPSGTPTPEVLWVTLLPWLWVTGAALMLLYSAVSYLRIRLRVQASVRLQDNVYLCDAVDTPFILGIARPRIYMPSDIDPSQLPYILAHENAHLARKDHWWKPLGYVLLSVHWFNPLLWVAYILLCRDIEQACDEKVIGNMDNTAKRGYLEALVACSLHRRMVMTCPVAFGEVGVKTRVRQIVNYRKPSFWIILAALVACLVTAVCFLTDPKTCDHVEQAEITLSSTCTAEGIKTYTCTLCGEIRQESIPMTDHSYGEAVVLSEATCTKESVLEHSCTLCGHTEQLTGPLLAHTPGSMTVTRESNCCEPGEQTAYCTMCSAPCGTEALPVNDVHSMQETSRTEPTCTQDGEANLTCTLCGQTETTVLTKLSHNFVVLSSQEGNYLFSGSTTKECTHCKEVLYEGHEINYDINFPSSLLPSNSITGIVGTAPTPPKTDPIDWENP